MTSCVHFYPAIQHIPSDAIVVDFGMNSMFKSIIEQRLDSDIQYIPLMNGNNSSVNVEMILSAIGRLYQLGLNPNISRLYPPVSYAVSRGTQSLSPLIQWDHSDDWFVPQYPHYFNSYTKL